MATFSKAIRRSDAVKVSFLLICLITIFLYRPLFFHKAFLYGDILFQQPLWNPYNASGTPFIANHQSAVFFPLNLLFYLLPPESAYGISAFLRLSLAGLFMYLFLRAIKITTFGSTVSAVSFTFCGFLVLWLNSPLTNVAIWLPLLFFLTEKLIATSDPLYIPLLSLVIGIQFLGGHGETSLHILSAGGGYFLFRTIAKYLKDKRGEDFFKLTLLFTGAAIAGLLLASIQLIPLIEYFQQSSVFQGRLLHSPSIFDLKRPFLIQIGALIFPYILGSPWEDSNYIGGMWRNFQDINGSYVGLLTLLLPALAIILQRRNKLVLFFLGLALLSSGVVYQLPIIFNFFHVLPPFEVTKNERMILLLAFSLCCLAGFGADILVGELKDRERRLVSKGNKLLILLGVLLLGGLVLLLFGQLPNPYHKLKPIYLDQLLSVLLILVAIIILLILRLKDRIATRYLKIAALCIIVFDLFSFGINYNPGIDIEMVFPETESIRFLKEDKTFFRVLPLKMAFPPDTGLVYKFFDLRGDDAVGIIGIRRYEEYLNLIGPSTPDPLAYELTLLL